MESVFSTYHPIINFSFFCFVIGTGIFLRHPVFAVIAVLTSFLYAILIDRKGTLKFCAMIVLPIILIYTVVNPFMNPRGATVLFYTKYSQVTLESAVYGCVSGMLMGSVLLWFSCYNKVMTTDKFVYLFGKIIPAISLVFTMAMRFIPNFRMQIQKISNAQKCMGMDVTKGHKREKARQGMKILSIMMTWALENAIDSADSMRSRGYGLKNRSTFSIYRFDKRDTMAAGYLLFTGVIVIVGMVSGVCGAEFYPRVTVRALDGMSVLLYFAYTCLCLFPILIELREALIWKLLQSKI